MKRMGEQECLHSERKVLSPDFKESNCQVCLRTISFTDMGPKEKKTINRLWKETLLTFLLTDPYLSAMSIFKKLKRDLRALLIDPQHNFQGKMPVSKFKE